MKYGLFHLVGAGKFFKDSPEDFHEILLKKDDIFSVKHSRAPNF